MQDVLVTPIPASRRRSSSTSVLDQRHERPAQPRVPVLHHPRRASRERPARARAPPVRPTCPGRDGTDEDHRMTPSRPEPRRPALPGSRRRRQAPRPAALPGLDRSQRARPGRDADRDVRVHDGPAALPPEPRARPRLRQVPRADRRPPLPADRGACRRHVLAVRAADETSSSRPAPRSRRRARAGTSPCRSPTAASCASSRPPARGSPRRSRRARSATTRTRSRARTRRASTRSTRCRSRATACSSGSPRRFRRAPCACASTARSRVSASIPRIPPLVWEAWTRRRLGRLRGRFGRHGRAQPRGRHRPARPRRARDRR